VMETRRAVDSVSIRSNSTSAVCLRHWRGNADRLHLLGHRSGLVGALCRADGLIAFNTMLRAAMTSGGLRGVITARWHVGILIPPR